MSDLLSTEEFIALAKSGKMGDAVVIVDNDCVDAYIGDDKVCDFHGDAPRRALIDVLAALGVSAEYP